jgi:metallo-beta-lactamase class B
MQQLTFFLLLFVFLTSNLGLSQLEFYPLNTNVWVYKTFQTYAGSKTDANGIIYRTEKGLVLIDTPWDSLQIIPLKDSIEKKFSLPLIAVFITHWHEDRTQGLTEYNTLKIPTFSTKATYQLCIENGADTAVNRFHQDSVFTFGASKIEFLYPGAGHTSDNMIVYFEKEKILFAGCFTKSIESKDLGNLSDANIGMWPIALKYASKRYKSAKIIVPGHGSWKGNCLKHTSKLLRSIY